MLPVIPHNRENFVKNGRVCMKCGQLDTRTGLCRIGIHHAAHANSGYCPQGDFGPGSNIRPEVWDDEQQARIDTCRGCVAFVKYHCGNDGHSVLAHARAGVCPMGNFGVEGMIESPAVEGAVQVQPVGKCCGG